MTLINRKILRVNLSTGNIRVDQIPNALAHDFVGGRGLAVRYLCSEVNPELDALEAENKLILGVGPLAGTSAQSVSRWIAVTKSPLTGFFARSIGGADFGAWLRFSGYEFIIIEGKSDRLVYLHLDGDGNCRILDAGHLKGLDTQVTQARIIQEHGASTRIACIGPAAEKGVRFAVIMSGTRTAARCGVGTVMADKNLKAVAITATRKVIISEPETFSKLVKMQVHAYKNDPLITRMHDWGTTAQSAGMNQMGIFPTRNFRAGRLPGIELISGDEFKKLRTGQTGCYSCMVRCGMVNAVTDGYYKGRACEGPEYETVWAFSGPTGCTSPGAIIAANQLCDEMGIDTMTTGSIIGFAYELYERGIISSADTGGIELVYGDDRAMIRLVNLIGRREGFGNILAEGIIRAAKLIGKNASDYAIHVKGLDPGAYEPRGAKSLGLNYATGSIGASHCYGYSMQELFGRAEPRKADRFADTGTGDLAAYNQDRQALIELGIVCMFPAWGSWLKELYPGMLAAATGDHSFAEYEYLRLAAERTYNLERLFNLGCGLKRSDDNLPARFTKEPQEPTGGPADGQMMGQLETLLDEYYQARGWDGNGIPTEQTLTRLGIKRL